MMGRQEQEPFEGDLALPSAKVHTSLRTMQGGSLEGVKPRCRTARDVSGPEQAPALRLAPLESLQNTFLGPDGLRVGSQTQYFSWGSTGNRRRGAFFKGRHRLRNNVEEAMVER